VVVQNPDWKISKNWEPGEGLCVFELRTKELKKYHKWDATTDLGKLFRSCREASISLVRSRLKTWEAETNIVWKRFKTLKSVEQAGRKLLIPKLLLNSHTIPRPCCLTWLLFRDYDDDLDGYLFMFSSLQMSTIGIVRMSLFCVIIQDTQTVSISWSTWLGKYSRCTVFISFIKKKTNNKTCLLRPSLPTTF